MASLLLIDYLERSRAHYSLHYHPNAWSAEETARLNRVQSRRFAKAVMVRADGELAMMIIPANYRVELPDLATELGAAKLELAEERHFQRRFPRCELGAIPPFGHLFGLRAFMIPALFDTTTDIYCKAGTHTELLRMPFGEFHRLAHAEAVQRGAASKLRKPSPGHLRRLLELAAGNPKPERTLLRAARPLAAPH